MHSFVSFDRAATILKWSPLQSHVFIASVSLVRQNRVGRFSIVALIVIKRLACFRESVVSFDVYYYR